jgi:transposase
MMVSPDHSIPLLYETYSGNRSDAKQFAVMLNNLRSKYQKITNKQSDITVIFDRGNNSEDNISLLESEDCPLHYVGGLKRNQCDDLYKIPENEYTGLDGIKGSRSVRRKMTVYSREMTVITVFNQNLFDGQMQGISVNIEKTLQQLTELQAKLYSRHTGAIKKGKKPTNASVEKQVNRILTTEFMDDIFTYSISSGTSGIPLMEFKFNEQAFVNLQSTVLGKTVLFTDRHEWSDVEIVTAYRSAWKIEHAFRQMKDTSHLTVRPVFHWTDAKIKVHIFYCVLAYRLCCLLKKELDDAGIQDSLDHILDEMKQYKYVITVIGNKKTDIIPSLTQPTRLASKILGRYCLKEKYLS